MTICVAFIRGINVGGRNVLPMATLRGVCEGIGLTGVRTHIQSGNVVFGCGARGAAGLMRVAGEIEGAIEKAVGFRPSVVVRTVEAVREALEGHPFAREKDVDPAHVLVMFLAAEPGKEAARALAGVKVQRERLVLRGRELFMHFPDGIGTSKVSMSAVERAVGVAGTCRNITTIGRVVALAEAGE